MCVLQPAPQTPLMGMCTGAAGEVSMLSIMQATGMHEVIRPGHPPDPGMTAGAEVAHQNPTAVSLAGKIQPGDHHDRMATPQSAHRPDLLPPDHLHAAAGLTAMVHPPPPLPPPSFSLTGTHRQ